MDAPSDKVQVVFERAAEIDSPTERQVYLAKACAGDPALRRAVETLLRAQESAGGFLDRPTVEKTAADSRTGLDSSGTLGVPLDPAEKVSLDFLQPSQQPGSLGRLGHYEVQELLGRGAFGIVFRAFDDQLHRIVAIKVLGPHLATTGTARQRFLREARSAAAVRNEHVVDIHAVDEQPVPYLVMEYVAGQALQQKLDAAGPLPVKETLRIGMQIAEGLAAAHRQGLVHRDIKPGNIMLENSVERVKITDFGLARAVDDTSMTRSGVVAGTPLFMAPEQAQGATLDHRADLFSLGSVLYVMCTGRPPFRAPNALAVLKRICEETPRPIRELNPEIPEWLSALVARLHAKNPDDRFASARAVADLLAHHLSDLQLRNSGLSAPARNPTRVVTPPSPPPAVTGTPPAARRWPWVVAALLLVASGLAVAERGGATNWTGTVGHWLHPSGLLVVEVEDPGVQVAVDGGAPILNGTGVRELHLRPGEYTVRATKDGKVLREEHISVLANARQVVRIGHEASPTLGATPLVAPFDADEARRQQTTWAARLSVPVESTNSNGMKMRLLPPGEFFMTPQYRVRLSKPFRLGRCEVTVGQFRAFVKETGYKTDAEASGKGGRVMNRERTSLTQPEFTWRHPDVAQGDDYPIAQVSWHDAGEFCKWLSRREKKTYRLPTEAEWEWACRAGTVTAYSFGDDAAQLDKYAWSEENSEWKSHPVGQKLPNAWGLYDMHGNVCEYCQDSWLEELPAGAVTDPQGPARGELRVIRGYSFADPADDLTTNARASFGPATEAMFHFGFRVLCEVPE